MEYKTALTEVFIETTNFCNLRCVFCPYGQIIRKKENMPFKNVIQLIDELDQHFIFDWISFHMYGEPLIHPDFLKIVRYASRQKQMNVNITTNGILMTPQILEGLMQTGVWKINLSIQAPPELFEVRGSKTMNGEDYHKILEALIHSFIALRSKYNEAVMELHYLDTCNFRPGTKLVESENEFLQLIEYWKNRLVKSFGNIEFYKEIIPTQDEGTGMLYEILPGLLLRLKPAISFGNAIKNPNVFKADAERKCYSGHCQFAFNSIAILANGDMVSCCLDHNGENILGNVFEEGGIKNVYEGERAHKFREQFIKGKIRSERCQECLGGVFFGAPI